MVYLVLEGRMVGKNKRKIFEICLLDCGSLLPFWARSLLRLDHGNSSVTSRLVGESGSLQPRTKRPSRLLFCLPLVAKTADEQHDSGDTDAGIRHIKRRPPATAGGNELVVKRKLDRDKIHDIAVREARP